MKSPTIKSFLDSTETKNKNSLYLSLIAPLVFPSQKASLCWNSFTTEGTGVSREPAMFNRTESTLLTYD